jgi:hypothetical protein
MQGLFDFEQDGRYALRRIPMAIRFKLDACGVKLPLSGWVLLSREQREQLLVAPCTTEQEQQTYRQQIVAMLEEHAGNPETTPEFVDVEQTPIWRDVSVVPAQLVEQLSELSVSVPTVEQWQSLSELQRFSLVKLTRVGHKNINLLPALKEFGLA